MEKIIRGRKEGRTTMPVFAHVAKPREGTMARHHALPKPAMPGENKNARVSQLYRPTLLRASRKPHAPSGDCDMVEYAADKGVSRYCYLGRIA
ncbi:hypothetical protein [Dyella humicola]|uniref:hypothetical protein n=1 Tax=Dyella humicola TaxID=2992126 RepID=UPI0022511C70|nr:hypothetical protein [Dyella humicola]